MKRKSMWKMLSVLLVISLGQSVTAFAESPASEAESVAESAAPSELKVLGEESEEAFRIELTNNTGKDIAYFGIDVYDPDSMEYDLTLQLKNALIEDGYLQADADPEKKQEAIAAYREAFGLSADGGIDSELLELLLGEGYDGNLLSQGDIFADGETRILYVPQMDEEFSIAENDPLAEAFKEFSLKPGYVVSFIGQGNTLSSNLFAFPASAMETAQLCIEEHIPYLLYTVPGSSELNSTLDAEKAASSVVYPQYEISDDKKD
jgi:hypothetical protein